MSIEEELNGPFPYQTVIGAKEALKTSVIYQSYKGDDSNPCQRKQRQSFN